MLLDESWVEALHLTPAEAVAFVLGRIDFGLYEWATAHLPECRRCAHLVAQIRPDEPITENVIIAMDGGLERINPAGADEQADQRDLSEAEEETEAEPTEEGVPLFQDKTLTCRVCGTAFVWTAAEQARAARRKRALLPSRCPQHEIAAEVRGLELVGVPCSGCDNVAYVTVGRPPDGTHYCEACRELMSSSRVRPKGTTV